MNAIKTISAVFIFSAVISAFAFAAPQNPDSSLLPGVASAMPNPTVKMSAQPYAYPTNRWWGGTYITNATYPGAYSFSMSLGTAYIEFLNSEYKGYKLSAPNVAVRAGDLAGLAPGSGSGYLQLCVSSVANTINYINPEPLKITSFSDWAVTAEMRDSANPALKMTTTFVKGGIFTYSAFSPGAYPDLRFGWVYSAEIYSNNAGGFILQQGAHWFAVYAPAGTTITKHNFNWAAGINFPPSADTEQERYIITAYLGSTEKYPNVNAVIPVFNEYRKYAYNFITGTKVSWVKNSDSSITTTFEYTTSPKRTDIDYQNGDTLFALYPHQWRNVLSASPNAAAPEYTTLRGKMKVYSGKSFKTKHNFYGVLPHLTYEIPAENRARLDTYINNEKSFNIAAGVFNNTYRRGKTMAKAANLIAVFHQAGKFTERNDMIAKLKAELTSWYNRSGHSFRYDGTWGGIIPNPTSKASGDGGGYGFGEDLYNDHHFHYGYFVYASAILAMYDPEFASNAKYKKMTDLLIRDFASPDRPGENGNNSFPFLRNFDVYEGHSWSNGKGTGSHGGDGNDQESISEAMNAWSAVYLWGVATNNDNWIKLGMYGYATESRASEEYYFDRYNETYRPYEAAYNHLGGILYDGALKYIVHWNSIIPQEKYGIWVLPLTPSMLYMGYDPATANKFYTKMQSESSGQDSRIWRDILLRYKALYDAAGALADWGNLAATADQEGSSLSFSYHFIHFFREYGQVNTGYVSNSPFFTAMKKGSQNTFFAFNNSSSSYKTVDVYNAGSFASLGKMELPPMTTVVSVSTNIANGRFIPLKYDSLGAMYHNKNAGWYALGLAKYADKAAISSFSAPATNPDCIYFPAAFEVKASANNISPAAVYVDADDLYFSSGTASGIKLAYYKDIPEVFEYPEQELTVKSSSETGASVRIKAQINKAGKYVLVMPFFTAAFEIGGEIFFHGGQMNDLQVHIYDTLLNSTSTLTVPADGKYGIPNAKAARKYIITPVSPGYEFTPQNLSYIVAAKKTDINFTADIAGSKNKKIYPYPNPYKPSRHGNTGIRFANLKAGAQIKIFNIAGEMVFDAKAASDGDYMWDVQNRSGYKIASGIYIYYINSGGNVTKGKLAVER